MAINQLDFYYYFLKSEVKPKQGVINAQLNIDGKKSVPISTKIKTPKILWNSKDQCFEGKESAKKESLKALFEKRMNSIREEMIRENPYDAIDPNEILKIHRLSKRQDIEAHKPMGRIEDSFLQHFAMYIKNQEDLVKVNRLAQITLDGYIAKRNRVMEFLRKNKLMNLKTENFTPAVLSKLNHWLILRGCEDSTIAKYERLVLTVSHWAKKTGLTKTKPLEDYKITKVEEKEPISLNSRELEAMEELRLSGEITESLCMTIDVYRFCAETSLSYCDYMTLTDAMFSQSASGKFWIKCYRHKSDVKHRIVVSDKALEIIERYGGIELLPKKTNNKLNKEIKIIATILEIEKKLTFHTSRKSAVNDMYNVKKMREPTIQAMVGWNSNRQFKRYVTVSDQTIEEEFLNT